MSPRHCFPYEYDPFFPNWIPRGEVVDSLLPLRGLRLRGQFSFDRRRFMFRLPFC